MNVFLDTEFNQHGTHVELLSLAFVKEDGLEYYAQNSDCSLDDANVFVKEHVIPLLDDTSWKSASEIKDDLLVFFKSELSQGLDLNVWTWYGNYDWVALCGTIFGDMTRTPLGFPYSCFDLSQYAHHLGLRGIPLDKPTRAHNALDDARWNRDAYRWLKRQEAKKKR